MYRPATRNEWWFCGILFTQAALVIALEIYILVEWQLWVTPRITEVPISFLIPIGLGILTFACLYQLLLSLDAIHHKNNILLFAICVANLCLVVYAALGVVTMQETTAGLYRDRYGTPTLIDTTRNVWTRIQPAEILVPIIMAISSIGLWPAAYFMHRDYSWAIYKCVHGNSEMRMRYMAYEVYLVLIKLDFFFLVAFIIQYNLIDVHFEEPEYSLTMAIIPATFIAMVLGIYFVQHEMISGIVPVIICYAGLIAYFTTRLLVLTGTSQRANTIGKDMMLLFASVALVLTVALLVCSVVCLINFNHGLKGVKKGVKAGRGATSSQVYILREDGSMRGSRGYELAEEWPQPREGGKAFEYSQSRMLLE